MRYTATFDIETDSADNSKGTTAWVPCVVPLQSFVMAGEPMLDTEPVLQAKYASVQVTLEDAATDANLVVTIEETLDRVQPVTNSTVGSFSAAQSVITDPIWAERIGYIRANVTTAGASATRARVTFIFTRTQ
ncbi:MAG: hypothetical protein MJH10_17815 [Epibacterium sp.]|nr:hypothetical protein [Epibacterium sp.]NQX75355.1 hypothetical protein [Epibacterium sp.]